VLSNFNEMASMELWYRALNCGFRCAISAGTDAFTNHIMGTVPGAGRVYVHVPGAFSYDRWVEQYKKGVSFATNGPSLTFTVDGKLPGDEIRVPAGSPSVSLRVKAVVDTLVPADRLEIVVNGQVVATQGAPASGTRWEIEREVSVERSSWIAARVLGPEHRLVINDAQAFAHSSPVYCYFGNQPIWSRQDAAFFVDWIDQLIASVEQRGVFRSPDRRDDVVQLFRKAQAIYRNGPAQSER
jgi:TolB protein